MSDEKPAISMMRATSNSREALSVQADKLIARLGSVPLSVWQWLVVAFVVVWLALTVSRLFWLVVPTPQIPPATVTPSAISSGLLDRFSGIDIGRLKSLTPFGRAEVTPIQAPVTQPVVNSNIEADASDTQLNLVLRGVVASSDKHRARAVIAQGDRQANYAIGDKLPEGNNVTLEKVLPNRVILKNNGKFESLWLFKDDKSKSLGVMNSAPVNFDQASAAPVGPSRPNTSPFAQRSGSDEAQAQVEAAVASNPGLSELGNSLTDVVSMSIHRENGQVVGYKIQPGRNVDAFNSFGLKAGDIVTAVNGMQLNNPGQIMEIYQNMANETSASLEIRRGESLVNVDINLR